MSVRASDRITANVEFIDTAVPEPTACMLILFGIGLIGSAMRAGSISRMRRSSA
ncbi:PEP-CTERM sorting domain-containing protein [Erythrobacter fulvus]|uniref:PEP-CTERM sorting domain-containing protein n=1 Tax=Erythrobacter fulvus TaxID=2987523 RepID=UPI0035AC1A0C